MSTSFALDPERSRIRIEARTSVGPVAWIGTAVTGSFTATLLDGGAIDLDGPASGEVVVPITNLRSGNRVYDGELLRRIDARRFPKATVALVSAQRLSDTSVSASASVVFHGQQRSVSGTLGLVVEEDGTVAVTGDQGLDIRDFGLPAPTMLMLKVYPDVRISLALFGRPD